MSDDLEDIKKRVAADKARIAALPWPKIGFMLSEKSAGVPMNLMHDYWDKKYREGVTLGADFWDYDATKEPNPVLRMAVELSRDDLARLETMKAGQ